MAAAIGNKYAVGSGCGRPRKYADPKTMSDRIDKYFNSISYQEKAKDDAGELLYDSDGELIYRTVFVSPPSVIGMCLFLGIDKDTLRTVYLSKEDFQASIKRAKSRIEQYLADSLNRTTQVAGIIFNLKNNFGWKDVQTIENTGPGGGPILIAATYSDDDLKLMAEIMERSVIEGEVVDIEGK